MLKRIYGYPANSLFDSPSFTNINGIIDNLTLLRIYQVCQEIHRLSVKPLVLVRDDLLSLLREELSDFPRITVKATSDLSVISPDSFDEIVIVADSTFKFDRTPSGLSRIFSCL